MAKVLISHGLPLPTGRAGEHSISGNTVGEVLDALCEQFPELRRHLFTDEGRLRRFLNVYLNDEDIRFLRRLDTPINAGDTITLVPSIAGGPGTNIEIEGAIERDASVDILVGDERPADAQLGRLEAAVIQLMGALGFNLGHADEPIRGSWFKRFGFHSRKPLTPEEASALYEGAEKALRELFSVGGISARPKELSRVARELIAAIEPFDNVTIRFGNLLLKKTTARGKKNLFLEVLSQARTDQLDGDPNALSNVTLSERSLNAFSLPLEVEESATLHSGGLGGGSTDDRNLRIRELYLRVREDDTPQRKGAALEELACEVFSSVPGFEVIHRNLNTTTEEIDLVIRNDGRDPRWRNESALILVECKNWHSRRVGKNEFVLFKEKLQNRYGRAKLGFLICTEHFAETADIERLRSSTSEFLIVLIDSDDLDELVRSSDRASKLRQFADHAALA